MTIAEKTTVKVLDIMGFAICTLCVWTLYANQIVSIA